MKFLAALAIFLAVALPRAHAQQSADDQYVIIYSLMQQANSLESSGQPRQALDEYVQVQGALQQFQKMFPDWNTNIVNYRLNYLAEKITEVTGQLPVATQSGTLAAATPPATNSPAPGTNFDAQLGALRAQVQQLQADNVTLGAKLKEALAVQPAAIDPRELARAREQIRLLMKTNALLEVVLSQQKAGTAGGAESDELKQLRAALAAQTERADKLAEENKALQARVQSLLASPEAAEALREENALLKKQLAEAQAAAKSNETAVLNSELAAAQKQIAALQSELKAGQSDRTAPENRAKQLPAGATNAAPADLMAQIDELTGEVDTLRARLAVDEAKVVPYTPEELALFRQPAPLPANLGAENATSDEMLQSQASNQTADPEKKPMSALPADSAVLVAEAQSYFASGQFDKAETDYLQILQRDTNNAPALANLAAIELEQNKLDDAEKYITAALAQNPNDTYDLSIFGYLKIQQGNYDAALDALSRAAKLDPTNPEIENYLGVALGHKGLREQAETALRKAIELNPNYGAAHNNLAVIYINEQPPMPDLARWHYEKALDDGEPRNPGLEKLLAEKGAPVDQ